MNGIEPPVFHSENGYIYAEFTLQGEIYRIEIYADAVNMRQGEQLFECYLRRELASDESLIAGFCARRRRYLGGGPWKGPDEKELVEFRIWRAFRNLFGRRA